MQFKVGDRVKASKDCCTAEKGKEYQIYKDNAGDLRIGNSTDTSGCQCEESWILIKETTNMNIKEKFVLALTPEPQKSFRRAGITNGDDLLTDDGQKIFLSWLLKKNQDDFKKEVVDDLLKEETK